MAAEPAFAVTAGEPGTLHVSGTLGFATAAAALEALRAGLRDGSRHQLDLAGVGTCDSAGMACLLTLLAEARTQGRALSLEHVPSGLRTLAQVSGVDQLLGG